MELPVQQESNDVVVLTIPLAHLDAANCEELERALTAPLEKYDRIVLNLKDVQFVDSSGVGVLLFSIRKVHNRGGMIKIAQPTEAVRMALDLVRIHRLVEVLDTQAHAIDACANQPAPAEDQSDDSPEAPEESA
jgi:anti-sigma B factor antagonist